MNTEHDLLLHLKTAYEIADNGDNLFLNDALGCKFCREVKYAIKPIIDKIERDIKIYNIKLYD